jgi:hypothetical protein
MAFQTPITIIEALERIDRDDFLLPAIQREVVWSTNQIARLFDSLMQGYPIGSFLFWKVEPEHSKDFVFYEFITDYHQKKNRHLKKHNMLNPRPITGVLDGQQRLTALNIGIRGSHSEKLPYKWAEFDSNYPERFLYLRLDAVADENEMGMVYDFRFLTPDQAKNQPEGGVHWFQVSKIRGMDPYQDIFAYVQENDLVQKGVTFPHKTLTRLYQLVHADPIISYYEERTQDLDKVLNIFIRVNSGGTELSHSDLLLSIATAQWNHVDAREVIHGLVDELNGTGIGFKFSKDLVLKAGLMLTDIQSVAFRVTNFNAKNMAALEANWDAIARSLRLAVRLLEQFGFSERALSADSVVLPIAYYLHLRSINESYLTHNGSQSDRECIRGWIVRSLLKPGIWGSGLDQLLLALRTTIREHGAEDFPVSEIEATMAQRGKSLRFEDEEIKTLSSMSFGDRRTFSFLSLLYPGMDFKNVFHIDHVFPANSFSRSKLQKAGVPDVEIDEFMNSYNLLPNLQLMEGPVNQSKQDKLPAEWITQHIPHEGARADDAMRHQLGTVPEDLTAFMDFFNARRERIERRAREVLGVPVLVD